MLVRSLAALCALTSFVLLPAQETKPSPEEIAAANVAAKVAAKDLSRALRDKRPAVRKSAIETAAQHDHDVVAKAIGRALTDRDTEVRRTAVTTLRYMTADAALDELIDAVEDFARDAELGPAYFLALGQRGDERAVDAIAWRAWNIESNQIHQARMYALAHVRSKKSIDAIVSISGKVQTPNARRGGTRDHRREVMYDALKLLVGDDAPRLDETWSTWWRKNAKKVEVTAVPKGLKEREQAKWRRTWDPAARDAGKPPAGGDGAAEKGGTGKGGAKKDAGGAPDRAGSA